MRLFWRVVKRIFGSVFLAVVTLVGAPVVCGITVLAALIFLPLPATIPIPKSNPTILPTVLYDRYGNQIAELQQYDRNVPFTEKQVPQVLKEAVVADEDRNFYHHGGVDLRGTLRALWSDLHHSGPLQGGSTITQQYVKLAFTNRKRTLVRKVREAILASQLDREASKDEILYRYLTVVYFGDGNYGAGAAAENYFHVPIQDLNASQAATLAGLIPAPSARAPREHGPLAEGARRLVLYKMFQQGYLTVKQYRAAVSQRLAQAPADGSRLPGRTVIYPFRANPTAYPDFVDYVISWMRVNMPGVDVYTAGLRIQTTLDPKVQTAAYSAVQNTLSGTAPPLEMSLAAVEPQTGFVPAVVGGREFGHGQFASDNFAIGGCEAKPGKGAQISVPATCWSGHSVLSGSPGRQPGSAWKPFVLATAFEQGIQPTAMYDGPGTYTIPNCTPTPRNQCTIHNAEPGARGQMTLAKATWDSVNTVYAQVAPQVGCDNVAKTAKALGVDSAYWSTPPFYACAPYALGEVHVSTLEMASAYSVFANHGMRAPATPILEVVNGAGKILVDNIRPLPKPTSVLPANVADNVTNVLTGVIGQGTGTAAQLGRPAAGKTGTASNYTNAWFVGYTPSLSAAVWMGNAAGEGTSIGYVKGYQPVFGGTWPALTWKSFMQQALQGVPATPFTAPAPIKPPQQAAALAGAAGPTTTLPITAGTPGVVDSTPPGGPYQVQVPPPYAPEPVQTTVPTTAPPSTTTTTTPGFPTTSQPGNTTTTTFPLVP